MWDLTSAAYKYERRAHKYERYANLPMEVDKLENHLLLGGFCFSKKKPPIKGANKD